MNNTIPKSMMDLAAVKIASLYPSPNQPLKLNDYPQQDYAVLTPGTLTTDQGDGRVDYRINDKNSLFGSISWSSTSKSNGPPFQGVLDGAGFTGASETDLGRNAQLSYTRIWTPNFISETRVGFSRLVTARTQPNANTDAFKTVGIGGYDPTGPLNGGLPQFGLGRYSQIGANDWLPTKEFSNVWDFIQNVAINKGSHALKFGAEYRPIRFPFFQVPYPHGEMNFNTNETALPSNQSDKGSPGSHGGTFSGDTGDQFASFLLGSINGGQISTTNFISSTRTAWAFYAQDDWKVTRKLTVQLGVRYELWSPIGEQFARQSNFNYDKLTLDIPKGPNQDAPLPPNFNTAYTFNGITFKPLFPSVKVSRGLVDQYLIPWDKYDIGPRLGLAWNIRERTVIRAAYGIFYGGEEQQGGNPNRGESVPPASTASIRTRSLQTETGLAASPRVIRSPSLRRSRSRRCSSGLFPRTFATPWCKSGTSRCSSNCPGKWYSKLATRVTINPISFCSPILTPSATSALLTALTAPIFGLSPSSAAFQEPRASVLAITMR